MMANDWVSNLLSDLLHVNPWVLSLFIGTYTVLGAAEYLILRSRVLSPRFRHYFVTVPTALVTVVYFVAFPGLRLLTIAIMTAWGFAKFFVSQVEQQIEREEGKKEEKYAVRSFE